MAMAGLGRVDEIWTWPLHYYLAVRREYLKIINPSRDAESSSGANGERVTGRRVVGPGIVIETIERSG